MKKRFNEWMGRNNMTFSVITGETVTNTEVVYAHIGMVVFILIIGFGGNF